MVELLAADEEVRKRRERGGQEQHGGHDEEPLAHADPLCGARRQALEREAEPARDRTRREERPDGLAVPERDGGREQDDDAEVLPEHAEEVERGLDVDGEPPLASAGRPCRATVTAP